jgi:tetratricopeptide (TPR) repeat protein
MMMRLAIVSMLLAVALGAAHAQPAPDDTATGSAGSDAGDPKQVAQARFAVGQHEYDAGEFLKAASEFEAAYALDPDPVYLYNAAQAYRLGSACARAADYYRRFLSVVPNPPNLDKVQHYLSELDACAKAEVVDEAATPHAETPPVAQPPQPQPTIVVTAPAPGPEGSRKLALPLAIATGGVAALVVASVLEHDVQTLEGYSQALCASSAVCQWDASKQARAEDLDSRGKRDAAISITAYAIGGAAIAASAVLYVLAPREPIAVAPTPGGAAVTAAFAF